MTKSILEKGKYNVLIEKRNDYLLSITISTVLKEIIWKTNYSLEDLNEILETEISNISNLIFEIKNSVENNKKKIQYSEENEAFVLSIYLFSKNPIFIIPIFKMDNWVDLNSEKMEENNKFETLIYFQGEDNLLINIKQNEKIWERTFSKEELDGYVLQENETDEMMAYHGTSADFNKFNHKKFLNTGAGSQSFGWGTYVTNDDTVAMGYSESSKRIPNEKYVDLIAAYLVNNKNMPDDVETKIKAEEYSSMLFSDYREVGGFDELKDVYEYYLKHPNHYNMNQEKIDLYTMFVDVLSNNKKEHAFLYEVEIPDDNGENYIEWYEHFPSEFMKRLLHGFLTIHQKYLDSIAEKDYGFKCDLYRDLQWINQNPNRAEEMINILSNSDDYDDFFSSGFYTQKPTTEGKFVYGRLRSLFGSPKAASLLLMHCGFDGIEYPSGTMWKKPDGAAEDAYNYVIFNANKVKITNKTKV